MTYQWQSKQALLSVAVLVSGGAVLVAGCSSSTSKSNASGATSSPSASAAPSTSASPSTSMSPHSTMSASGSPAPSASASKIPCKQIDSLRTSVTSLTQTKVTAASAGKLTTDLTNIQTQLTALKAQTGGAFASQTSELTASIDQIKKAAAGLTTNPTTAVKSLTTAINDLKAKAKPMVAQINAVCPKK